MIAILKEHGAMKARDLAAAAGIADSRTVAPQLTGRTQARANDRAPVGRSRHLDPVAKGLQSGVTMPRVALISRTTSLSPKEIGQVFVTDDGIEETTDAAQRVVDEYWGSVLDSEHLPITDPAQWVAALPSAIHGAFLRAERLPSSL